MKSVALAYHFVRQHQAAGVINIHHIRSEDDYAESLTKPLNSAQLRQRIDHYFAVTSHFDYPNIGYLLASSPLSLTTVTSAVNTAATAVATAARQDATAAEPDNKKSTAAAVAARHQAAVVSILSSVSSISSESYSVGVSITPAFFVLLYTQLLCKSLAH